MKKKPTEYRPINGQQKKYTCHLLLLLMLPFLLILPSCSSNGAKPADPDVKVSLRAIERDGEAGIAISKDALNREFLFQGNRVILAGIRCHRRYVSQGCPGGNAGNHHP
ncbi:hypothetical protein [Desulfobotulus mexicanus]|uniref:Uncharacterized protein n=1 Tax=Desulfobotulus mexicanus TaxID=2586642 RepID=A0A5Q4VJ08_9BACT|nr:hypothetical protein [Desulfobotulus mexicanus]TYT75961.1 hypothetical protein FIM25_03445 [Desulfobotulus mexicanus]